MKKSRPVELLEHLRPEGATVGLFLLSLLLAAGYWTYTVSEVKSVKDLTVPLQFANVPKDMLVAGEDSHRAVTVEIKGPPELVRKITEEDVDARVDVSKMHFGPQAIEIGQDHVRLPSSVEFVRAFPIMVHVILDRKWSDSLPLQPTFTGHTAPGTQVLSWTIDPPSVRVEGPETSVRKLKRVPTQPISLDGRAATFQMPVVPTFSDPDLTVSAADAATLTVTIGEKRAQRTIGPLPIAILHAGQRTIELSPASLRVMVEGPESLVRSLGIQDIASEIDVKGLAPSSKAYELRPAVRFDNRALAGKVEITGWTDKFISVRVSPPSSAPGPPSIGMGETP